MQQIKKEISIILSWFFRHFYGVQGFHHSFVYVNVFSSCRDNSNSVDQFTDFERFPDSKLLLFFFIFQRSILLWKRKTKELSPCC